MRKFAPNAVIPGSLDNYPSPIPPLSRSLYGEARYCRPVMQQRKGENEIRGEKKVK